MGLKTVGSLIRMRSAWKHTEMEGGCWVEVEGILKWVGLFEVIGVIMIRDVTW